MRVDDLSEAELPELARRCSNVGRWGPLDEQGTLNLITPDKRRRAAGLVIEGTTISLARVRRPGDPGVRLDMVELGDEAAWTCRDQLTIETHTIGLTHLDALGHVYLGGNIYNGREAAVEVTPSGLGFADVCALRDGVFTRGVLLDVCAVRGAAWLQPGDKIFSDDLIAAELLTGVTVGPGDAIFVHSGIEERERVTGPEDPAIRPGLAAEAIGWLRERDVAVYSGDCFEALPSGYRDYPLPLHMIGSSMMGLVILDNPSMIALLRTCAELSRGEFLLTCAPWPVTGGTASPVNPVAVF